LSQIKNVNLLLYRGAGIVALRDHISFEAAQAKLKEQVAESESWPDARKYAYYAQTAERLIRAYPYLAFKMEITGAFRLFKDSGLGYLNALYQIMPIYSSPLKEILHLDVRGFYRNWIVGRWDYFAIYVYTWGYLMFLYLGCLLGFAALAIKKEHLIKHGLLIGFVCYIVMVSAGPEAYSRFRVPIMPILCLYAAYGYVQVKRRLFHRPS
jgi:hypothetical protein